MPETLVQLAVAALNLLERLLPVIGERVAAGEITVETQNKLVNAFTSLQLRANGEFAGDYWKIEPDPILTEQPNQPS